jgi:N-acetylglucosamine malate deacetylase 1
LAAPGTFHAECFDVLQTAEEVRQIVVFDRNAVTICRTRQTATNEQCCEALLTSFVSQGDFMQVGDVLVLAPHPDDESLGCGGTLRLLTQAGAAVDVAFLTRGENGVPALQEHSERAQARLAVTRESEARAACAILGVREVEFLSGIDGGLSNQPHLAHSLAGLLGEGKYKRIFAPWYGEAHPDHVATFRLLQRAVRAAEVTPAIWLYEVWTPLAPTDYVPIDATIDAKRAAIEKHQSQLACLDYLNAFLGLAAYRAMFCAPAKYAEAFLQMDTQTLLALESS